jgi:hypothetical protein
LTEDKGLWLWGEVKGVDIVVVLGLDSRGVGDCWEDKLEVCIDGEGGIVVIGLGVGRKVESVGLSDVTEMGWFEGNSSV